MGRCFQPLQSLLKYQCCFLPFLSEAKDPQQPQKVQQNKGSAGDDAEGNKPVRVFASHALPPPFIRPADAGRVTQQHNRKDTGALCPGKMPAEF